MVESRPTSVLRLYESVVGGTQYLQFTASVDSLSLGLIDHGYELFDIMNNSVLSRTSGVYSLL